MTYTDEENALMDKMERYHQTLPHTPGPWEAEEDERGRWRVVSRAYNDEEPGICGDHSKAWALTEDDAKIIAKAPIMLALLREAAHMGMPYGPSWFGQIGWAKRVDEALKDVPGAYVENPADSLVAPDVAF